MIPNIYRGCFFAVEGIDGCGKSEQFKRIMAWLLENHKTAIGTKEPGKNRIYGAEIYRDLRDPNGLHATDPFRFQMFYACDSKENLRKEIIPRIRAGCNVVSDRFRPSMVYGARPPFPNWIGLASKFGPTTRILQKLMEMTQYIIGEDFIWPDAILIFNVSVDTAVKRLQSQGKALDGYEKAQILSPVKENYITFSRIYPNCHLIDGESDPDEVFKRVKQILEPILESKNKKDVV